MMNIAVQFGCGSGKPSIPANGFPSHKEFMQYHNWSFQKKLDHYGAPNNTKYYSGKHPYPGKTPYQVVCEKFPDKPWLKCSS